MTVDVKVPVLAESIPDATLLEWRKRPGDRVEQDEILIELETDKVVLEVPAPAAGILAEVLKQTGDMVLSQEVLARIDSGESASATAPGAGAGIVSGIAAGSAPAAAAASGGGVPASAAATVPGSESPASASTGTSGAEAPVSTSAAGAGSEAPVSASPAAPGAVPSAPAPSATPGSEASASTPAAVPDSGVAAAADRGRLSPAVRRLVGEHNLDPSGIAGTGRNGRITKGDVLAHLEAAAKPTAGVAPLSPAGSAPVPASDAPALAPALAGSAPEPASGAPVPASALAGSAPEPASGAPAPASALAGSAPEPASGAPAPASASTGSAPELASEVPVPAPVSAGPAPAAPASTTPAPAPASASGTSAPAPAPVGSTPAEPAPGSRGERREPMSRLRRRIAERLVEAQHTAAILTTFNEIDMQPVIALRARHKEGFERRHGVRLGFMSFFAKAAVQALERFPAVNARIEDGDVVYYDYCDIGVAVGSPRGLVVPILRNVEAMSFAAIEAKIAEFGTKARDGTLTLDEMSGGTFTISNGGVFGSLLSTPILNPPQSGILGMHKTEERPVVENGEVVVRPMMYVALSYDHRIIDGREAVQFLISVKEAIEDPARLLLDV